MNEGRHPFFPSTRDRAKAIQVGFRFGHVGTHSSRTMMFEELSAVLAAVPGTAREEAYAAAIVDDNCLAKQTVANRRHSWQHLRELYSFDPTTPLFRVLARLWPMDVFGRRLLALLATLARDPLMLSTAAVITALPEASEFQRGVMRSAIDKAAGDRLGESTVEKVIRNTASSWAQAGHLEGRTFKVRRVVKATPATVAFALYLADAAGFHGQDALGSAWLRVLDCGTSRATELALEAKRLGLIDLRTAGDVFDLDLARLDPALPEGSRT
jgi:hypothetical protein